MKSRRDAREAALQALYACDTLDLWTEQVVTQFFEVFQPEIMGEESREPTPELVTFAHKLISGTMVARAQIDGCVASASTRWSVPRMCRVDRNIIRIATYELLHAPETPTNVILNEAIEIAKRFGAEDSASFVNGVLDKVAQQARPDEARARTIKRAVNE